MIACETEDSPNWSGSDLTQAWESPTLNIPAGQSACSMDRSGRFFICRESRRMDNLSWSPIESRLLFERTQMIWWC